MWVQGSSGQLRSGPALLTPSIMAAVQSGWPSGTRSRGHHIKPTSPSAEPHPGLLLSLKMGTCIPRAAFGPFTQPLHEDTLPQSRTGSCQLLFPIPYLPGAASLGGHRPGTTSILFESAGHGQSRRKNQTQERRAQWFPHLSAARLKFTRKSTFL